MAIESTAMREQNEDIQGREPTGLELMRSVLLGAGERPGIGRLLGMIPVSVDEGRVVFDLDPRAELYNPLGSVHGGVSATLLDSAMACAVHTTLSAGARYTTLEIKVNYVRAITAETGRVRCEGTVIHARRESGDRGGQGNRRLREAVRACDNNMHAFPLTRPGRPCVECATRGGRAWKS